MFKCITSRNPATIAGFSLYKKRNGTEIPLRPSIVSDHLVFLRKAKIRSSAEMKSFFFPLSLRKPAFYGPDGEGGGNAQAPDFFGNQALAHSIRIRKDGFTFLNFDLWSRKTIIPSASFHCNLPFSCKILFKQKEARYPPRSSHQKFYDSVSLRKSRTKCKE